MVSKRWSKECRARAITNEPAGGEELVLIKGPEQSPPSLENFDLNDPENHLNDVHHINEEMQAGKLSVDDDVNNAVSSSSKVTVHQLSTIFSSYPSSIMNFFS